jgi:GGDEF domain-containing protein
MPNFADIDGEIETPAVPKTAPSFNAIDGDLEQPGPTPAQHVEADLPENAFSQAAPVYLGAGLDAKGKVVPVVSANVAEDRYQADLVSKAERLRALMQGINVTTQEGVDKHASTLRLADETGMRYEDAAANFDEIARMHKLAEADPVMWMRANPELTKLIFERPELAPVIQADHKVNALSRAWNWMDDHGLLGFDSPSDFDLKRATELRKLHPETGGEFAGIKQLRAEKAALRDQPKKETLVEDEQAKSTREGSLLDMSGWQVVGGGLFVPKAWLVPGYRFTEAWAQQKISRSGYELLLARGRGDTQAAEEIEARIHNQRLDAVRRNYGEGEVGRVFSSFATAAASTAYGLKEGVTVGTVAGSIGAALTFAITKNPAAAGEVFAGFSSLFGKAGAVKGTFELEAGNAYLTLLQAKGKDGKPVPEETARTAAAIYGTLASAVEFASWGPILKAMGPAGQLIRDGEVKAVTQAWMNNDAFRAAVKRSASHWLPSAVAEGGEEGIQDALEQVIGHFAKGGTVGELPAAYNKQQTVEAAGEGTIGGIGLGGIAVATGIYSASLMRDRAISNGQIVSDLLGLEGSPTVVAAPGAVAALVEQATAKSGTPVTTLYLDPQRVVRLFQSSGGDVNQAVTQLLGDDGPKMLQEALAQGKRLAVPAQTYLQKFGGSEAAHALAPDTSTSPIAPTLRDVAEFDKALKEASATVGDEKATSQEEQDFIDAAEASLAKVQGEGQQKARLQLNVWRAFVRTMQERLGTNGPSFFKGLSLMVHEADAKNDVEGNPILGPDILFQRAAESTGVMRSEEYFRDRNTGLLNDEAWKALEQTPPPGKPLVGHISVEGIKYLNDNTDHETADLLYRAVARGLHAADPLAAKVGGDFAVRVKDQAELDRVLEKVRASMPEQLKGFEITGMVGKNVDEAGKKHGAANAERVQKGERANPRPPHPTLVDEHGKPEAMAPEKPKGLKVDLKDLVFSEERATAAIPEHLAKQVSELTPEQYLQKAYRDQKTGEWTARGWAALPRKAHVVSIDVKGLRFVNDTYGPETGDKMLERVGMVAQELGGIEFDFAHLHGDEYAAQADDPKALEAFVAELEAVLDRNPVQYEERETGGLTPVKVEFHYGFGERSLEAADADLNARKKRVKKARAAGLELRRSGPAGSENDGRAGAGSNSAGDQQAASSSEEVADTLEERIKRARAGIAKLRVNKADAEAFLEYVEGKGPRPNIKPSLERMLGNRYGVVDPLGWPFDENGRDIRGKPASSQKRNNFLKPWDLVGNLRDAYENRKAQPMSRSVFSGGEKGKAPRGYTDLKLNQEVQKLFKVALTEQQNLSTFLHESGHIFLKLMQQAATEPTAPEALKVDYATALKWLGGESIEKLTTEQHEKFARGFERYLLEGEAPSAKLKGPFSAFKLWLKGVYRSAAGLNVELNDEIRGVFDRLLATDAELEAQKTRMGVTQPTAQDILRMSPAEYREYLDDREAAFQHAALQAEHTAMREQLRQHERWWKDESKKERERAEDDYEQLPARIAQQTLWGRGELKGTRKDGAVPLARELVVAAVGEKNAKKFPTTTTESEATDPDEIADFLGFPTGKAMLEAVIALPDKAKWVKATAIDRMAEKHGDVLEERQRLADIIAKGLHGDMTAKILAREAAALVTHVPGAAMVPDDVIRAAAKDQVARTALGKLDPSAALASERKAANDYAKACAQQNFQQALIFKNRQRLNMYLFRELSTARDMAEDLNDLAKKMGDRKGRYDLGKGHPVFLGGSDLILEALGFKPPSPRETPLPSIGEVVTELMKFDTVGFDEQIVQGVIARAMDPQNGWRRVDPRTITVDEAKNVLAALKNIKAAARGRREVLIDGKRMAKEDAIARLQASAAANLPPKPPPPTKGAETPRQRIGGWWNAHDGELRKPEFMLNRLGGRDTNSPWHQFIVKQLQHAKHLEADLMKSHAEPVLAALKKLATSGRALEKIDGEALFPNHTKDAAAPQKRFELWMMLLNAGNTSNLERLTLGRRITEDEIRQAAIKVGITDDEAAAIQGVMDAFEDLGRLSFDLEERDSGLRPDKIEAKEWTSPSGKRFRGGYFPAVYDPNVTNVGAKQEAAQLFDPGYVRPGTARGHLKSRVEGFNDVISLSVDSIARHTAQVIHDLAYRERLKAVANLVLDDDVQRTLRTYLGTGKAAVLPQWLRDIGQMRGAESTRTPKLTGIVKWVRGNLPAVLGYKPKLALEDYTTNLSTACIGTGLEMKHLAAGLQAVKLYDRAAMADAEARSGELRSRHDQIQRDLLKTQARLTEANIPGRKALRFYKDHAFVMQQMADRASSAIIWLAAERQYLEQHQDENGDKVAREAVDFADAMVRKVMPSHSPVDASALMRDKGPIGAYLVFFGYFNHAYNREADIIEQAIDAKTARERAMKIGAALGFMVAVSVISSIIRGQGPSPGDEPDDEKDPVKRKLLKARNYTARKLLVGTLELHPLTGPLGQAGEAWVLGKKNTGVRNNSVVGIFEGVAKSYMQALDGNKDPDKRLKAFLRTLEPTLGISTGQLTDTGGFLWDWHQGDVQPRGAGDVLGGLYTGQREGQGANPFTLGQDAYETIAH